MLHYDILYSIIVSASRSPPGLDWGHFRGHLLHFGGHFGGNFLFLDALCGRFGVIFGGRRRRGAPKAPQEAPPPK